jgi:uncharacterized protein (DUF427 family)
MPRAVWRGATLAESDATIVVEGNHYFPPDSIDRRYFVPSSHHTFCHWTGQASYCTVQVNDARNENAAWYYPDPKPAAENIRNHIAFWHGVRVVEDAVTAHRVLDSASRHSS